MGSTHRQSKQMHYFTFLAFCSFSSAKRPKRNIFTAIQESQSFQTSTRTPSKKLFNEYGDCLTLNTTLTDVSEVKYRYYCNEGHFYAQMKSCNYLLENWIFRFDELDRLKGCTNVIRGNGE